MMITLPEPTPLTLPALMASPRALDRDAVTKPLEDDTDLPLSRSANGARAGRRCGDAITASLCRFLKLLVTGDGGEHDGALVWRLLIGPDGSGRWSVISSATITSGEPNGGRGCVKAPRA